MNRRLKVLVTDESPDLLDLYELLLGEAGYDTKSVPMGPDVLEIAKAYHPDAILFDLVPGHTEGIAILDQLRTNAETQSMPVVATSTSVEVLAESVASHNVRQVLYKPSNADDVEKKVSAAISQAPLLTLVPPLLVADSPLFVEVALGIATRSRAMVIRWVQRLATVEPFRSRKLDLASTINQVPVLLHATIVALQSADFRTLLNEHPAVRDAVVEHVTLRRSQGLVLADIVTEFQLLREEIRCEIAGILKGRVVTPEETLEIVSRKDFALDTILRIIAETYEHQLRLQNEGQ